MLPDCGLRPGWRSGTAPRAPRQSAAFVPVAAVCQNGIEAFPDGPNRGLKSCQLVQTIRDTSTHATMRFVETAPQFLQSLCPGNERGAATKRSSRHGTLFATPSPQRGRAATSEAFPFSRPRWFNRGSRCTDISKGRMTRIRIEPWTPRNDPVVAAVGGALAVAAALAAGLGSRVAPPVFGAVLALALAADWGLSALAEPEGSYRARGVALARWLLAAGWLSFGVL